MTKRIKTLLLILLMLVLWLPFYQGLFGGFKEMQLKGAFVKPGQPEFLLDSFLTCGFQKNWEAYAEYSFGFRGFLVKLKNSIEYVLFKEAVNEDIITGKNGVLYSYGSAERTIKGRFYNGKEKNLSTINDIKFLKEKTEARGGHFLAVIIPSKESVMPEFLPSSYDNAIALHSDYKDFVEGYAKQNIPCVDLTAYFRKIYKTSPYTLFTKSGFHWSVYGASVAQDTILNYCRSLFSKPIPAYARKGIEWSDTARFADSDFEEPMNLLFSLQRAPYAYPQLEMISSTLKNYRPKVIVIGDSFFWQIKNIKLLMRIFSEDSQFWYYFKTSFPITDANGTEIQNMDVIAEIESADIVMLAGSMGTLGDFPFGVTDYYKANHDKPNLLKSLSGLIRNDTVWMKKLNDSASAGGMPVEKIIHAAAARIIKEKRTMHLRAFNGKYVCADGARNDTVLANRESPSGWETFTLLNLGNYKCVISSSANKFFSAELGHQNEITATRAHIAAWEIFEMIELGKNEVAFKAANGKYLSVDEKTLQVFASADSVGKNEKFEMIMK